MLVLNSSVPWWWWTQLSPCDTLPSAYSVTQSPSDRYAPSNFPGSKITHRGGVIDPWKDSIVARMRASGHRSAIWQSDHFNYESIYTVRNQVFLSFPAVGDPSHNERNGWTHFTKIVFLGSSNIKTEPKQRFEKVKTKSIKKTTTKKKQTNRNECPI